jgi:pectin methylesterase-like acyl-CoA thioesterase
MIRTLTLIAAGLTLTACASTPLETGPQSEFAPETGGEMQLCAAEAYQVLVGQPVGGVHTDSLPVRTGCMAPATSSPPITARNA